VDILYQDRDLVVVNKRAGMVVHVGAGNREGTLVNALLHHLGQLADAGDDLRPGIVHRLDRFTSGVLIVARTDAAHRALQTQFARREVEKVYLALVHGCPAPAEGSIDKPVTRDPHRRTRMTARLATGRSALTHYRAIECLDGFTLLEVRIGTGRTHQIRVHLASIGHPVAGDRLYGAPGPAEGQPEPRRYFLHAHRIGFRSPSSGQPITVESPLPDDLRRWIGQLRARATKGPIINE
jgi:23S rRNA pseudouridine1911/1915/1917 synthase